MYVLDDVSFIAHPNTGSRSLKYALLKAGAKEVLSHHEVCPITAANTRACVCAVRNPFTLMASWYHRAQINNPYAYWLTNTLKADRHYEGPQVLGLFYGTLWATHIIKFENLQSELNVVTEKLGLPRLVLEHVGKSKHSVNYAAMYDHDDEAQLLIRNAYGHHLVQHRYRL